MSASSPKHHFHHPPTRISYCPRAPRTSPPALPTAWGDHSSLLQATPGNTGQTASWAHSYSMSARTLRDKKQKPSLIQFGLGVGRGWVFQQVHSSTYQGSATSHFQHTRLFPTDDSQCSHLNGYLYYARSSPPRTEPRTRGLFASPSIRPRDTAPRTGSLRPGMAAVKTHHSQWNNRGSVKIPRGKGEHGKHAGAAHSIFHPGREAARTGCARRVWLSPSAWQPEPTTLPRPPPPGAHGRLPRSAGWPGPGRGLLPTERRSTEAARDRDSTVPPTVPLAGFPVPAAPPRCQSRAAPRVRS